MPKKSLGQNFLMHPQTAERIVLVAEVPKGVTVLEIGPGTGMLTRALIAAGNKVIAVEADGDLAEGLSQTFAPEIEDEKLVVVLGDIRAFNIASLPKSYAVVANIPYYITGEIIRTFLTAAHKPQSMTLLVQKEVAERIARSGKGKNPKESLLSLSVKAFGSPKYCFTVPRGAFRPAPIQDIRQDAFESPATEKAFFDVLRAGFAHKRKLLKGNLAIHYPGDRVEAAFEAAGIDPKSRSEDLPLEKWQELASILT
jgi:16S rRNA (adenine1518-N6/adenine1519-N6)-dimethyltransferase